MALTKISTGMLKQDAASSDLNIDAGTLYIDVSNNRVGVANTSPSQALDVTGAIQTDTSFRAYDSVNTAYRNVLRYDGGNVRLETGTGSSASGIGMWTAGSERMRIDSSGNVGIGTTAPTSKLTVNTGASGNTAAFSSGTSTSGDYSGITLHAYSISGVEWYGSEIRSTLTASNPNYNNPRLGFFTQDHDTYLPADRTEKMSILSNGNVGIGTATPSTSLHIERTSGNATQLVNATANNTRATIETKAKTSGGVEVRGVLGSYGDATKVDIGTLSNHNLSILTNNTERVRFMASGNVGIGTTDPQEKLQINGNLRMFSAGYPLIDIGITTSNYFRFLHDNPNDIFKIGKNGAATLNIGGSGNVGIGTTDPQAALHIYDTRAEIVRMEGNDEFAYASFYGTVSSTAQRLGYMGFANDTSTAADFNFANNQGGIFSFNAGIETVGTVHNDSTQVGFKHTAHGVATGNTNKHSFQIGRWVGTYTKWMLVPETEGTPTYQREFGFNFVENSWFAEGPFQFTSSVGIGTSSPVTSLSFGEDSTGITFLSTATNFNSGKVAGIRGEVGGTGYGNLAFDTFQGGNGGGERMMIRYDGNVGIGDTSPEEKLSVYGAVTSSYQAANFAAGPYRANMDIVYGTKKVRIGSIQGSNTPTGSEGEVGIYVNSGEKVTIDTSGNVGIGVTSIPSWANLMTQGTVAVGGILYMKDTQKIQGLSGFPGAASNLNLNPDGGSVGIGTDSPQDRLHILAPINSGIRLQTPTANNSFGAENRIDFHMSNEVSQGTGNPAARIASYLQRNNNGYGIKFGVRYDSSTFNADAMTLTAEGNVGIGTSSPTGSLQTGAYMPFNSSGRYLTVNNTNGAYLNLQSTKSTAGDQLGAVMWTDTNGATDAHQQVAMIDAIVVDSGADTTDGASMRFFTKVAGSASSTPYMTLAHNGNLFVGKTGFGVTTAGCAIANNGTSQFITSGDNNTPMAIGSANDVTLTLVNFHGASATPGGTISISGGTSVAYNTSSDARLKENIVDAQDAGELIDSIQVREFDWKNSGEHQRYGMVAQELLEVAPEVVHQPDDEEEMMGVDYSKLVPMLVKEIQSLRARVAELEGE